jgi:hypothetical protein
MSTLQKIRLILLVCISILLQVHLSAQRQSDVVWAGNSFFSTPWEAPFRNFLLVFNEDSLEYIDNETPIVLSGLDSRAAYSDRNGNFKFASNGWRLVNSAGEILSYKLWRDDMLWPGGSSDTSLVSLSKGPLFLEDPGDSNRVYLFYGQYKTIYPTWPSVFTSINYDLFFTYALLDVSNQSLINQNNVVLTDTTSVSDAVAVRHGNGRDWWILKPGIYTNEFYVALLDPSGLSEMEKITIPGLVPREQTTTVSHFTQDGNTFIHFTGLGPKWVQRYDFDRCSGTLSNPQETDLTGLFREQDPCNFTISPDGSKFYAVRLNYNDSNYLAGNYQYDFDTDILTHLNNNFSGLSFLTPNFKEVLFFTRMVPNAITDAYYSSYSNPNAAGFDCDIQMFKYELLNFPYMLYAPNFANYRLGPLLGSECDPLTTNSLLVQKELKKSVDVFPNPNHGILNIKVNNTSNKENKICIHNALGQVVYSQVNLENQLQLNMLELQLKSGIYWVTVEAENQLLRKKFVFSK